VSAIYFQNQNKQINPDKNVIERIYVSTNKKLPIDSNEPSDILIDLLNQLSHYQEADLNETIKSIYEFIQSKDSNAERRDKSKEFNKKYINCNDRFDLETFLANFDQQNDLDLLILVQDIFLLIISTHFYDFTKIITNNNNIQLFFNDNGQKRKIATFLHCESLIALKLTSSNDASYIGVSKLCCPLCQMLLFYSNFQYRGNHACLNASLVNWRIPENGIEESKEKIIQNFHIWLMEFYTHFIKETESDLKKYISQINNRLISNKPIDKSLNI
jgi:hypothetical protein